MNLPAPLAPDSASAAVIDSLTQVLQGRGDSILRATVDSLARAATSTQLEAAERINGQLALGWTPWSTFIAALGLLFAVGAIAAGYLLYRQGSDFRQQLTQQREAADRTLAAQIREHESTYAGMVQAHQDAIADQRETLAVFLSGAREQFTQAHGELEELLDAARAKANPTPPASEQPGQPPADAVEEAGLSRRASQINAHLSVLNTTLEEAARVTGAAYRRRSVKLRSMAIFAYESQCAISGPAPRELLQIASILPAGERLSERPEGVPDVLVLRSDIHELFDRGLIALQPDTMRVLVSEELRGSEYARFSGAAAHLPPDRGWWPNPEALRQHLGTIARRPFLPFHQPD
jgi:hypothetical protein